MVVVAMSENFNLREYKKVVARQRILDAAAYEFKTHGFANTAISDIMRGANLGVGTFYNYFNSKEEVLMNLVKNLFKQVEERIEIARQENLSSLELLEICCKSTAELINDNRFILPLLSSALEHSDKPEQNPKNISPGFKEIFDEIILSGQQTGEFRKDIPVEIVAEMFHSIYQAAAFSKLKIPFKENINLKIKILLDGIKKR